VDGSAVLLVEDHASSELAPALSRCGFAVTPARSPETALFEYGQGDVVAVVAAVPLPGMGTEAMCEQLRRRGRTPILLTSRDRSSRSGREWRAALEAGADDHVSVPCDDGLLEERLRTLITRSDRSLTAVRVVRIGRLTVRLRAGALDRPVEVDLTSVQATLLDQLAAHRGALVGSGALAGRIRAVHGSDATCDLASQLGGLRTAVGEASGIAGAVQEVAGAGWRLVPTDQPVLRPSRRP